MIVLEEIIVTTKVITEFVHVYLSVSVRTGQYFLFFLVLVIAYSRVGIGSPRMPIDGCPSFVYWWLLIQ